MGVVGMVGPAGWCGSGAHGVRRCGHVRRVVAGAPWMLLQVGPSAVAVVRCVVQVTTVLALLIAASLSWQVRGRLG